VTETGWGEFPLNIRVQFQQETGEKTVAFGHQLRLHHWGPPALGPQPQAEGSGSQEQGASGSGSGAQKEGGGETQGVKQGETGQDGTVSGTGGSTSRMGTPAGEGATPKSGGGPSGSVGDQDAEGEDDLAPTPIEVDGEDEATTEAAAQGASQGDESGDMDVEMKDANAAEVKPEPKDDAQMVTVVDPAAKDGNETVEPLTASSTDSSTPVVQINPLPVHSWQYDQFVFTDPTTTLYQLLLDHPETPLPRRSLRTGQGKHMGEGAILGVDRGSAGVPLEFTQEMEVAERERLEQARRSLVEETDRWRQVAMRGSLFSKGTRADWNLPYGLDNA
jgi:YEATS domain-containing protein 4